MYFSTCGYIIHLHLGGVCVQHFNIKVRVKLFCHVQRKLNCICVHLLSFVFSLTYWQLLRNLFLNYVHVPWLDSISP